MKTKKRSINIFEYVDYRLLLADYYAAQKKIQRGFTYRSFAKKAGVAASCFKDIQSHRQNLTLAGAKKYAAAMELTKKEEEYFRSLVCFNNGKTNAEKNRFLGEMVRLRSRTQARFLESRQYEFFSRWYNAVVREMVTHKGCGDDPDAIAREIGPAVTPAQVCRSIALLKDLNLIYQDGNGKWLATDKVVSSEYEIKSAALKNYHSGMLECARFALENIPSPRREFQGMTLSATKETYLKLKERIHLFTDEVLNTVASEQEKAEVVFQLNLQLFPFAFEDDRR
jgi:uncharacterized protein (TIGR02147 family)